MWMLLIISASQAIAQADDALSETNVNNQEPSFFESLFGSDQNTDDNTVASSNDAEKIDGELINAQLKSLLQKQEELSS